MSRSLSIVGISGSLREGSYSTRLLREAARCVPASMTISLLSIHDLPLYNGDIDQNGGPPAVQTFKQAIGAADGVLIVTPEYNYSIPGVLKNALDWASRPAYRSVFAQKPVGMLSVSAGPMGGCRAQIHLRDVLFGMLAAVFPHKEFLLTSVASKFDADGNLTDPNARELLVQYLQDWAQFFLKSA